jgi:hypothetical protein
MTTVFTSIGEHVDPGAIDVEKKKARGDGIMVRIAPDIVRMARIIAPAKGEAIGDYLSGILRATVSRDYVKEVKRLEKAGEES